VKNNTGDGRRSINFAIVEANSRPLEPLGETASTADDCVGRTVHASPIAHQKPSPAAADTRCGECIARQKSRQKPQGRNIDRHTEASQKALRVEATKRGVNWFWSLKVITTPT